MVAELIPPGQNPQLRSSLSALVELARRGQLTLGAPNESELYPNLSPLLRAGRARELLNRERSEF